MIILALKFTREEGFFSYVTPFKILQSFLLNRDLAKHHSQMLDTCTPSVISLSPVKQQSQPIATLFHFLKTDEKKIAVVSTNQKHLNFNWN